MKRFFSALSVLWSAIALSGCAPEPTVGFTLWQLPSQADDMAVLM